MQGDGTPIWDDIASPEDLAVLDPGAPDGLPDAADVLVIGGGVIGLAIAAMCTRAGMDVLLLERGRLAGQASGRAAGGLSPDAHPELGGAWREAAQRSLELHRGLDADWDYGLRSLDLRVLPDLVVEAQGHVDPVRFCASLARHAGTIATGVEVSAFDPPVVRTSRGEVRAAHVVFATGGPPPFIRGDVPEAWIKGHLIATEPAPLRFDEIVVPPPGELLFVQLPDGRIVGGGTKDHGIEHAAVDETVVQRLRGEMVRTIPGTDELRVTHRWTCFRPRAIDDLPIVDRVPHIDQAFFAAGFYSTGILMAPVVGAIVAAAIAGDDVLPPLFAIGRS